MLHLGDEPESVLVSHQVIPEVKLLQLPKVIILVQHLSMKRRELVSSQVQSFEPWDLSDSLKQQGWVHERRRGGELVRGQVQVLELL